MYRQINEITYYFITEIRVLGRLMGKNLRIFTVLLFEDAVLHVNTGFSRTVGIDGAFENVPGVVHVIYCIQINGVLKKSINNVKNWAFFGISASIPIP